MRFSVLASGSTGNAFYVETERERLLVDAGLSGKQLEQLFAHIDRHIQDVTGVLVTHEHSDHIKGLGVIARKYRLPIYANEKHGKRWTGSLVTFHLNKNLFSNWYRSDVWRYRC